MRTILARSATSAALGALLLTGTAAAQEAPSRLLNSLEVEQLVSRGESDDHMRLQAHFTALSAQYEQDAKRHTSMSQRFIGNPSRNLGSTMRAHCQRLAALNTESATTLRELAKYHEQLAGGRSASPPSAGAPFQRGAGAPAPTDEELNALAAKATTPAEHRVLAGYFQAQSKRYAAEADQHVALAKTYRGTRIAQAAVQHERLAQLSRDAAKSASEAGEMHHGLADTTR
jgi:hypothetical protein